MRPDLFPDGWVGPITGRHELPAGAKAWLLLDWDGVLNVDVSQSQARKRHLRRIRVAVDSFIFRFHLHTWLSNKLLRDAYPHLAPGWATSWWFEANDLLGNRIGLGPWPTSKLDYYCDDPSASKLDGILELVGDAPFIWVEDDPLPGDAERVAALPQPALLLVTDPTVGFTPELLERASVWAASL